MATQISYFLPINSREPGAISQTTKNNMKTGNSWPKLQSMRKCLHKDRTHCDLQDRCYCKPLDLISMRFGTSRSDCDWARQYAGKRTAEMWIYTSIPKHSPPFIVLF